MAESQRVPYEEGYFTVPASPEELPRLLGTRCRGCGEHFYPRRLTCARCLSDDVQEVKLGPRGRLYTHTYLYAPGFGEHSSGMIYETALQLRGEAGKRQVENARVGLCHLVGGGSICCIHLLMRE